MADSNLYARFYVHPQLQQHKSEEEGRPIYKDVDYVELIIKGQKNSTFSRPVKEQDKEEYPKAWRAFKDNNPDLSEGTPIKFLPGVGPSVELELKSMGIHTIEDFAGLSDAALDNVKGGRMFQKRAEAYLSTLEIKPEQEMVEDEPVDVEAMERDSNVIAKEPVKKTRGRPKKVA